MVRLVGAVQSHEAGTGCRTARCDRLMTRPCREIFPKFACRNQYYIMRNFGKICLRKKKFAYKKFACAPRKILAWANSPQLTRLLRSCSARRVFRPISSTKHAPSFISRLVSCCRRASIHARSPRRMPVSGSLATGPTPVMPCGSHVVLHDMSDMSDMSEYVGIRRNMSDQGSILGHAMNAIAFNRFQNWPPTPLPGSAVSAGPPGLEIIDLARADD